jgi:hypothetical protein
MLEPEDQSLSKRQPVIDTNIERTGVRRYGHGHIRLFETEISKEGLWQKPTSGQFIGFSDKS